MNIWRKIVERVDKDNDEDVRVRLECGHVLPVAEAFIDLKNDSMMCEECLFEQSSAGPCGARRLRRFVSRIGLFLRRFL